MQPARPKKGVTSLKLPREFASSTFFRLGAVRKARPWWLRWLGGYEVPVGQKTRKVETEYQLPAGKFVVLSCRSYRPRSGEKQVERTISVSAKGDGFVGAWPEEVRVDSRYNEQRIILACKRTLDAVMSPVAFVVKPSASTAGGDQTAGPKVIGPQILLLMKIATPRWIILAIFLCFFFGPIILTLGPDSYEKIFAASPRFKPLVGFESQFTAAGKFVGAVITGIGDFIGFRRLPLRS